MLPAPLPSILPAAILAASAVVLAVVPGGPGRASRIIATMAGAAAAPFVFIQLLSGGAGGAAAAVAHCAAALAFAAFFIREAMAVMDEVHGLGVVAMTVAGTYLIAAIVAAVRSVLDAETLGTGAGPAFLLYVLGAFAVALVCLARVIDGVIPAPRTG